MTGALNAFLLAFAFSFVGSIPPGTINLTILQIGLDKKIVTAWKFALAAAAIEYPYGWIAVKFSSLILSSPGITKNLHLLTGIVMILIGALNLWNASKPTALTRKLDESGFRRGIVLGILNPLAIPFWVAMTAYMKGQEWINLSPLLHLHAYLTGVFLGALCLLITLAYLAGKVATLFVQKTFIKKIPGVVLIVLGLYAFYQMLV